jgi:drug/metabolite transporter (DMT)-like permease
LRDAGVRARAAALAAVVVWGLSFVATKAALAELSPVALIVARFGLGVVTLIAILLVRRTPVLPPRDVVPGLVGIAFVGIFLHQMLQVHGLGSTTAVRTGWLIGIIPIWTAVLSALLLGERFGVQKITGLAIGTLGAILLVTRGDLAFATLDAGTLHGDLLVLGSTLTWAVYTVAGRATLARLGSARTTTTVMALGLLMFLPWFVATGAWREYAGLTGTGVACVLFLGVFCSALGYLCWYAALERLDASQVAAFLYLEPLVTFAAAMVLLGETVHWTTVVGGVLVLLGVAAVERG